MRISIMEAEGIVPKTEPRLLGENQAQIARNCILTSGRIGAIKEPGSVTSLPDASRITIFPYNSDWLSWTTDVDVVRGPLADDQYQRIYYTGDGVPKVRGIESGTEYEYDLGLPKPTNAIVPSATAKAATTWTRTWTYQYESSASEITQEGTLAEGAGAGDVVEVTPGSVYTIDSMPARTSADQTDVFVLVCQADDTNGTYLGKVYPDISNYSDVKAVAGSSDMYVDGAHVTAEQLNATTTPNVTFTFAYDTTRAEDYKVNRSYTYAFVSGWGEVGPPADASISVAVSPVQDCTLSNFDTSVAGNYNVTHIYIYRTVVDAQSVTAYQYVTQQAIGTATYTDTATDADTGETLLTTSWLTPEATLSGLVALPNGSLAGFVGKTVYFSVPNQPHAWRPDDGYTVDYDIVGLGVSENSLIVGTEGIPYTIIGDDPSLMSVVKVVSGDPEKPEFRQACANKQSIAGAAYASPDGLVVISGAVGRIATKSFYSEEQWRDLTPANMIGEFYDGRYYGWSGSTTIIIDFNMERSGLTTTDVAVTGLYSDLLTDTLYLIQDDAITSWNSGTDYLELIWKGRKNHFSLPLSPNCARLVADSYPDDDPPTMKIYGDDTLQTTIEFEDYYARKIPTLADAKTWEIEIVAKCDIYEATIATSMDEMKG